jgi:uncharacterized protein (TIGR03437 family)
MKLFLWFLVGGFSVAGIHAQTCPAVNFLQGGKVPVYDSTSVAGLQRQADGSFTRQRYKIQSPYAKLDSVANYQSAFLNCSGTGARAFKTPAGWTALADQPGAASQTMVFSDFLGNGTPVGLAVVAKGTMAGATVDSLLVAIFNSDGSAKSTTYYPVISNPNGLVVGDFNHDGKKDVVVVSSGSSSAGSNTITVFLGKGDGTLQPAAYYPAHTSALSAVAFDFNGDNNLDLAILNGGSADVSILLGKGDGTFAAPVNYPVTQGLSLALGDFNGDGHADLVAGGSQNLSVLLGNGNGTFRAAVNLATPITASAMAPGDFNNDGKLDLAVADSNGGTVSILLGDGTGKFPSENDYAAAYEPIGLLATDLDGDGSLDVLVGTGHPDVLLPNSNSGVFTAFFGRGDGTLIGPPAYPTGGAIGGNHSMALADFNGDGKPDVAVAAGDVWILLSLGGGSFKTPVRLAMPTLNNSSVSADTLAAGDFNGDGRQDLVVGTAYGDGVYVFLGNGDGTFQAPVQYTTGGNVTSVAVADFNGDGKLDIAACGYSSSPPANANAGILLGNGNGAFQSVRSLTGFGAGPYSLVVADFNNDGKPDLAIANQGTPGDANDVGGVLVFLGQGNGSFQSPTSYPAGINPNFITAADVNGDGAQDLLVATGAPNFTYDVAVLRGVGNGTFGSTALFPTDYGPAWIAVADLNGDGKPDLAIAHCCGDTDTTFMLGNGDGTFQPDVHLAASVSPGALLLTDLNGDTRPDLITLAAGFSSDVAVFLNETLMDVNGASFLAGPLAPNSFATAVAPGEALATVSESAALPYPTNVGGTTVTVTDSAGVSRQAGLSYVSSGQVNYVVPSGSATGPATVTVSVGATAVTGGGVTIAPIGPGLFLFQGTNIVAAYVTRVTADNSQTNENIYTINSSGALVAAPIDLGPATDQVYLILYGTGVRGHSSASNSVTATAGGVNLTVSWAGAQNTAYPGLDQINVLLPQSLAGKGDVVIQVTVDGQAANPGHVTIQ